MHNQHTTNMILHGSVLDDEFHDIQMVVGGSEVQRKCAR